jgi:hypothetical protein
MRWKRLLEATHELWKREIMWVMGGEYTRQAYKSEEQTKFVSRRVLL